MAHFNFFCNKECEFFPCHKTDDPEHFNCMFCYCPLYSMKECGGQYIMNANGMKDCSACLLPHKDYNYVIKKLFDIQLEGD